MRIATAHHVLSVAGTDAAVATGRGFPMGPVTSGSTTGRPLVLIVDVDTVITNHIVKVQQSDTDAGAGYADVSGLTLTATAAGRFAQCKDITKKWVRAVDTTNGVGTGTAEIYLLPVRGTAPNGEGALGAGV